MNFGGVEVGNEASHGATDGRRLLVSHGDEFDGVVKYARWLALLGDWAYVTMLQVNTWFNFLRRKLGFGYWSLSASLKHRVKTAVQFISNFEIGRASCRERVCQYV